MSSLDSKKIAHWLLENSKSHSIGSSSLNLIFELPNLGFFFIKVSAVHLNLSSKLALKSRVKTQTTQKVRLVRSNRLFNANFEDKFK
jgi:hypothetical protein